MVTSYLPSPVRPDGVLKRHPDTPFAVAKAQSIPRTPTSTSPAFSQFTTQLLRRYFANTTKTYKQGNSKFEQNIK